MISQRLIDIFVGLFLVFTMTALCVLAFKVSGLTNLFPVKSYEISAEFDDIGGLKIRAPVKIGGVQIGQVSEITLDPTTYKAVVKMTIEDEFNDIPDDSSAGIFTAGLLGDNYIAITPMYSKTMMVNGNQIEDTHSAMVLEKLIGQFLYKVGNGSDKNSNGDNNATKKTNS